jgi:glutathione S-transferase
VAERTKAALLSISGQSKRRDHEGEAIMTTLTIIGGPRSSYVRTARMTCIEKGVAHELRPIELGGEGHRALHPWGKIPALEHGPFRLYETTAICRYIDDAFEGPSLTPNDPQERARMEQWISVLNSYWYEDLVKSYALQYIFPRGADGQPNRELIARSVSSMSRHLDPVEQALEGRAWLAGDAISLADLFYGPVLVTVTMFPEAKAAIESRPNLKGLLDRISDRPSFREVHAS